jgi:hypothetical protein
MAKLDERGQDCLDPGRLANHRLGDPGQYGDEWGYARPGIHQRLESSDDLASQVLDRSDLRNLTRIGRCAGGLEVQDAECDGVEWQTQILQGKLTRDCHPIDTKSNICSMSRSVCSITL